MRTINFHHPQMARSFERVCVCWFREISEVIVNFVSLFLMLNDDLAKFLKCFWVLQSTTFGIPFSNWLPPFRLILWFNEYSFYDIHLVISIIGSFSPFGIETCSLKCQIAWKRERDRDHYMQKRSTRWHIQSSQIFATLISQCEKQAESIILYDFKFCMKHVFRQIVFFSLWYSIVYNNNKPKFRNQNKEVECMSLCWKLKVRSCENIMYCWCVSMSILGCERSLFFSSQPQNKTNDILLGNILSLCFVIMIQSRERDLIIWSIFSHPNENAKIMKRMMQTRVDNRAICRTKNIGNSKIERQKGFHG